MTLKYPLTIEEMINIHGVREGKQKSTVPLLLLIKQYVDENNIARPDDILVHDAVLILD